MKVRWYHNGKLDKEIVIDYIEDNENIIPKHKADDYSWNIEEVMDITNIDLDKQIIERIGIRHKK